MPSFEPLFTESNGQPIVWNGRPLALMDKLRHVEGNQYRVYMEKFNSEWKQGVRLDAAVKARLASSWKMKIVGKPRFFGRRQLRLRLTLK